MRPIVHIASAPVNGYDDRPPAESPKSRSNTKSRCNTNLALLAFARPLTRAGGHTYAAIWPYVNRTAAHRPRSRRAARLSRESVLVRDDGHLLFDLLTRPDTPAAPDAARNPCRTGTCARCKCPRT